MNRATRTYLIMAIVFGLLAVSLILYSLTLPDYTPKKVEEYRLDGSEALPEQVPEQYKFPKY